MRTPRISRALALTGAAAISLSSVALSAYAATPKADDNYGTQYGSVLRARMSEHFDGSGKQLRIYGSSACTAATTSPDISIGSITRNGWNDAISRAYDFNKCDIWFFKDANFRGTAWPGGYKNWGTGGAYVGDSWNDSISSFRIS